MIKKKQLSRIPAYGRLRKEDGAFQSSLRNIADPVLKHSTN
jgi:hypothetical protein